MIFDQPYDTNICSVSTADFADSERAEYPFWCIDMAARSAQLASLTEVRDAAG